MLTNDSDDYNADCNNDYNNITLTNNITMTITI